MLDTKLTRIKELIETKEKVDTELAQLIGEIEKPKRGRPTKEKDPAETGSSQGGTGVATEPR